MRGRSLVIPIGAVLLVLLELAAYKRGGAAAVVASRLWLLHAVFFVVASLIALLAALTEDLRRRQVLTLVTLAWAALLVLWPIGSSQRLAINADGTQQVAAGMENLDKPALGYTGTAFLGYPSRQYLPLAVPPKIMGPSLVALRLGAAILVLLGVGVFAAGVKALIGGEQAGTIAGLAALALFTFPYVAVQLPFYDQTILPFAFVCLAVGWLALAWSRFTMVRFLAAMWSIAMLGTGYTPGLAPWGLGLVLLLLLAARRWAARDRAEALAWASGAFWSAGIGALSFLTRIDVQVAKDTTPLQVDAIARAATTLKILLFGDPIFFWSPLLMLPVMLVLLLALVGRGGLVAFLVAAWSIGVLFVSTQLRGYTIPTVEFALHRAIVIVPPVLALLAFRARASIGDGGVWRKAGVWITAILMAAFSWHLFSRSWKHSINFSAREAFVSDLEAERIARGWSRDMRFALGLQSRQSDLSNVEVLASYFWPKARVVRSDADLERAVREMRDFVLYVDRSTSVPSWLEGAIESRRNVDLRGPSWTYEMVRASGSASEKWLARRGALPALEEKTITLGSRTVRARYSPADMGQIQDLFDLDWLTLLRTKSASTAIVDLEFEKPRSLSGVSVWTATMNVGLRVFLYGASEKPRSFEKIWPDAGSDPDVALRFPSREHDVHRIRVEIANLQGGDGHIHVREVRLID